MENLPSHLTQEILFQLDRKSLACFKCVSRSFRSKISEPEFNMAYFSRLPPGLIHVSCFGSKELRYVSSDQTVTEAEAYLPMRCQILGSVSGLVLLFLHVLCVLNPITKKFRFLGTEASSRFEQNIRSIRSKRLMTIGFWVDNIDPTTQRFRVVSISQQQVKSHPHRSSYRFVIYNGDDGSWRVSETTIACPASKLVKGVKPVYFNRALHWLRRDGSIVAFNPEKDEARIIPTTSPSLGSAPLRLWLGAFDGNQTLTIISATEDVISVFTLQDGPIPAWVLEKQISNDVIEEGRYLFWTLVTHNGRFLAVEESEEQGQSRMLHGYDVVAKKWRVLGAVPTWMDTNQDFFDFKPSWLAVEGLEPFPSMTAIRKSSCKEPLLSLDQFMHMIGTNCGQI